MFEIVPEPHRGMPAMGLYVLAQSGDLEGTSLDHQSDSAVGKPRRYHFQSRLAGFFHHRFWQMGGCHIDICDGALHQHIAHHPADQSHAVIRGIQE